MKIRNKKTGEIREIHDHELANYGITHPTMQFAAGGDVPGGSFAGSGGGGGSFSNISPEDASSYINMGEGIVTDAVGLLGNKSRYKGASTGKLIGNTAGTAIGSVIGGPIGGQIGGQILGAIGTMIGARGDERKMTAAEENLTRRQYGRLDIGTNVNAYGNTYSDGGVVDGDPTKPRKVQSVPKGYVAYPEMGANYYHNPQQSKSTSNTNGPKMSNAAWSKFVANRNSKIQNTDDIVYTEPQPVQQNSNIDPAFMTRSEHIFGTDNKAKGALYSSMPQSVNDGKQDKMYHFGYYNPGTTDVNPEQIYDIPSDQWTKMAGAVNTIKDTSGISNYKRATPRLSAAHFEDGGMVNDNAKPPVAPPSNGQGRRTNIEKGELMINPVDYSIIREFNNKNRYSAHKTNHYDEPMGNWVDVPSGAVIIPKKLSMRYKTGDTLSKKSILLQILSDQAGDPMFNVPEQEKPEGYQPPSEETSENGQSPSEQPNEGTQAKKGGRFMKKRMNTMFADGGSPFIRYANRVNGTEPRDIQSPMAPGWEPGMPVPYHISAIDLNGAIENFAGVPGTNQSVGQQPPAAKSGVNWAAVGRKALGNLPIFEQMAVNLQGDPNLEHNPNSGFDNARGLIQQQPDEISIAGGLAANDRSYDLSIRGNNNRSEKGAMLGAKIAGDNQLYTNKATTDVGLKSSKLQTLANLTVQQGADFQADRGRYDETASQNAAARDNNFSAALSNVVNNELQAGNDEETIKALNSMTSMVDIDPYAKDMIKEDPGATAFIFKTMLAGHGTVSYDAAKEQYYRITGRTDPSKDKNQTKTTDYNINRGGKKTTGSKTETTKSN